MFKKLQALAAVALLGAASLSQAAGWPEKPVQWVVPYSAGGGSDVIARLVASSLEKSLDQTIVVENKPGAATIIGATYVQNAKPDGYVVGTADSGTLAYNPSLYSKLSYDPDEFTYIGGLARFPLMLAVRQESPFKSVQDVIDAARKSPGKLSSASAGAGSPHHLALEMFKQRADVKILHVPYKGAAPALQDLLGGQVDMGFVDSAAALSNIKAGKLRVLAVATPERIALLPDVPTMAEAGVKDFNAYAWQGLVGPKGMPEEAVSRLGEALQTALKSQEVDGKIRSMGVEPMPMSSGDFKAYAQAQREEWAEVIKTANIRLD
ncbi:tripartite tricarboxylate transporter substrate binding protein [Allopusillimonas soli]|uniref:Tripartite tricarboxylate transporter substrate binding protein n=1 Tax=Allopusillimonas soli TaxID=659016 RepID=A0A853FCP9_9BURK|nr:tripartite tricarboxylate transporter substrate binding protein [Allopusillimonas soli]NYT37528.1 tripartite tricarboxylate transporter substrate binding protein [Allopusillimonas soli]TEA74498.1 tripartite tricarboxylate transporter substrate binding protein [Allopusillimonas soli]